MLPKFTQNNLSRLMLTAGLCLTTVFVNQIDCNATQTTETPSLDGSQLALKIKRADRKRVAGLTIFDGQGELAKHSTAGDIKVVTLYAQGASDSQVAIDQIVKSYRKQFGTSVVQVTNEDDLKASFGVGENLINNDPTPELIQVALFFGRNIGGVEAGCSTPACEKP